MKTLSLLITVIILSLTIVSCKKEVGPKGATGAPGSDGNANVKTFIINNVIHSLANNSFFSTIDSIKPEEFENNAFLGFANYGPYEWFAVPGSYRSQYHLLSYIQYFPGSQNLSYVISPINFDGTDNWSADSIHKVKIMMIAPSEIVNRSSATPTERVKAELQQSGVDINNYAAVCRYYGIKE